MSENIRNEIIVGNIPKSTIKVGNGSAVGLDRVKGEICNLHYHDYIELLPIYDGELIAIVDGKEYAAYDGDVIFINSGVPHSTYSNKGILKSGLIQFKETEFLDTEITKIIKYSARFKNLSNESVRVIKSDELFAYTAEVMRESCEKKKVYDLYIRSGIYKILGYLYRNGILSDYEEMYHSKEVQKILPVLSHINKNYSENITLEEMSALLGFDQSYFCRLFKIATGATFTEYLNFVRICRAEKMLGRTEKSILEISEEVGFSSVSYFNRIFKRYRNCSPRYYRSAVYANM